MFVGEDEFVRMNATLSIRELVPERTTMLRDQNLRRNFLFRYGILIMEPLRAFIEVLGRVEVVLLWSVHITTRLMRDLYRQMRHQMNFRRVEVLAFEMPVRKRHNLFG